MKKVLIKKKKITIKKPGVARFQGNEFLLRKWAYVSKSKTKFSVNLESILMYIIAFASPIANNSTLDMKCPVAATKQMCYDSEKKNNNIKK